MESTYIYKEISRVTVNMTKKFINDKKKCTGISMITKYDYTGIKYRNDHTLVRIKCLVHSYFGITLTYHIAEN